MPPAPTLRTRLRRALDASGSHVCVGLDPDPALMPDGSGSGSDSSDFAAFNRAIVDATCDLVAAYKPQLAFYEAAGIDGLRALHATVQHIRDVAPHALVIGDAKRGDIAHTGRAYATAMFDRLDFDAATVSPYLGAEAITPFLERPDRGAFVLCWTSNPGGAAIQGITGTDGNTLADAVAALSHTLGNVENVGLVVAPSPDPRTGNMSTSVLETMATRYPDTPLLIPGVGAQGGSASHCARVAGRNYLINSSRGIIYASRDPSDFADAARRAVVELRAQVAEGNRAAAANSTSPDDKHRTPIAEEIRVVDG